MMSVTPSPPRSLSPAGRAGALALRAAVVVVVMIVVAPARGQDQRSSDAPRPASTKSAEPAKVPTTVSPGESVQAAIDKAAPGSTIMLGRGVHSERVTITKPLTLAGEGGESTTLGPDKSAPSLTQQQKDEFFRRLEAATDPEQRARIALEMAAVVQPPTVTVKDAADVTIAGIGIRGPYTGNPGGVNPSETLLRFDNAARAVMDNCIVAGPFSNGVTIVNGSDVRITRSLIAAVWGTGVQVYTGERGQSGAKPAKVHLDDSDVRNCYHRCVTISGDAGSVIERCRISGSAWHGIRYDHCSPTIKGNLIFGNARFGIYASGKTAAKVAGNVFWRNEMEGMGCWFNNADDVEGNTFVGNLRGGVTVLGDSKTKLTKNVIANHPIGVHGGGISGRNNEVTGSPQPQLVANVFFGNEHDIQISGEAKPLPEGNVIADPKFAAPAKGEFTLAPDSPARKLGAGAAAPLSPASPFPIQPGEQAMIPDGETREYQRWKHNPPAKAAADAPPDARTDARPAAAALSPAGPAMEKAEASSVAATDKQRERQRAFAKMRVRQDQRRFSMDAVAEVDELYQVANKNWRSDEARASVKTMTERFPEFNRTGCAVLNLAQSSSGAEREQYLTLAIAKHGDCFYPNGVQVGAWGRYLLAHDYEEQGKSVEAERLFDEIRRNYPEAITHRGELLVAVLREEAKGTTKPSTATQPTQSLNRR